LIVDLVEYRKMTQRKAQVKNIKTVPVIKIFTPPINDTIPFYYTEVKKEQK
jgi:hypothetical protein